jgi:hypothetical protein
VVAKDWPPSCDARGMDSELVSDDCVNDKETTDRAHLAQIPRHRD